MKGSKIFEKNIWPLYFVRDKKMLYISDIKRVLGRSQNQKLLNYRRYYIDDSQSLTMLDGVFLYSFFPHNIDPGRIFYGQK